MWKKSYPEFKAEVQLGGDSIDSIKLTENFANPEKLLIKFLDRAPARILYAEEAQILAMELLKWVAGPDDKLKSVEIKFNDAGQPHFHYRYGEPNL